MGVPGGCQTGLADCPRDRQIDAGSAAWGVRAGGLSRSGLTAYSPGSAAMPSAASATDGIGHQPRRPRSTLVDLGRVPGERHAEGDARRAGRRGATSR